MVFDPNNMRGETGGSKRPEGEVASRYSFKQDEIGRKDQYVEHISGTVRIIEYAKPNDEQTIKIHDILCDAGLVLGKEIDVYSENEANEIIAYRVNESLRPLKEESSSQASGEFSYGDDSLFADLGRLLAKVRSKGLIFNGELGANVAIVEFTEKGQARLLFAPGVEYFMRFERPGMGSLPYYGEMLANEFDNRFRHAADNFRYGYLSEIIRSMPERK